jgi:O-antigen ligase
MKVRIVAAFGLPLLAMLLLTKVSDPVRHRLASTYSNDSEGPNNEADESEKSRRFLLDESIRLSFQYPLFGVGPGQFENFEGKKSGWHSTHNSFTEISSETGIPGIAFYLGAVISSFLLLQRTWKQVRERPELKEITVACYCLSMSYVVFCTVIFFLNFGYLFYLPAATGLIIAVSSVAQRELAALRVPKQSSPGSSRSGQMHQFRPATMVAPVLSPRPRAFRFNRL